MNAQIIHAACPHDCPDTCAIRVTVENGVAVRVQGDPDHPPTHGALCTKVARYTERVYHPERLLHPLKRVGPKGSGRFEAVGWDDALSAIAERLRLIAARDPEAILPYSYSGTLGLIQGEAMASRFFNRLGAARLDRTICASAGSAALNATYGSRVGMHVEHFQESRLILIWAATASPPTCISGPLRRRPNALAPNSSASIRGVPKPPTSVMNTSRCCLGPTARWRLA